MEEKLICPECGSSEIGKGKQAGHAVLRPVGKIFSASEVIADVCTDCGYILKLKVAKPHNFKETVY
jgi:predicted RNA-binding Zn-ribbon protein involved in translation (DUF1610 family)